MEISINFLVHLLRIESNLFMLPPTLFTPHQLFTPTLLLWKSFHCQQRQIASVVLPKLLPYSRRRTFDVSLRCLSLESLPNEWCDERRRRLSYLPNDCDEGVECVEFGISSDSVRQIASVVLPKLPYSRRRTFDVSLRCLAEFGITAKRL